MKRIVFGLVAILTLMQYVFAKPLDIVAGKSGEQQVKEALDRAEKESALAAKEREKKNRDNKEKEDTENFLNSLDKDIDSSTEDTDKSTRSSTDLKSTLDKKVEELAKFHEKHGKSSLSPSLSSSLLEHHRLESNKLNEMSVLIKHEKDSALEALQNAEKKEKENAALEEESDKKMVEMANKLNNLVVKFQKKMGRLSHRPKNSEDLIPEKEDNGESTVKSIRGKPATHTPLDLAALRNALGLIRTKSKTTDESNAKTSYKEDTKLEDRLAMEAEEEKKFSNGDTYDDGEYDGKSSVSAASSVSTLSPKEQASQEMQNYNALISSESNRELSQIQEEITKATQSSMGQVSVVGQKEQVTTEPANFPELPGINDASFSLGGSAGSVDVSGLTGSGGLGNLGGDLQTFSQGGLGGMEVSAATGSEVSAQPTSTMIEQAGGGMQPLSSSTVNLETPIDIGGSQQPVEMGTLGAGQNPFQGSQSNILEGLQADQSQQNFMTQTSQQAPIEIGGPLGAGDQQQSMAFKKSKILNNKKQIKVYNSSKRSKTKNSKRHSIHRSKEYRNEMKI